MNDHRASARPLPAQNKAFLAIESIDKVLADRPAFTPLHGLNAPIAIADPSLHDLAHALSDLETWMTNTRLSLGRLRLARQSAGPPLAVAVMRGHIGDNFFHERWPGNFFDRTSCKARAEAVAERPMFRSAFKSRRCIIPASGFYEWTGTKDVKMPHYFSAPDRRTLAFTGL
jgi:hypothetical protein